MCDRECPYTTAGVDQWCDECLEDLAFEDRLEWLIDQAEYAAYLDALDRAERLSDEAWHQRLLDADVECGAVEL